MKGILLIIFLTLPALAFTQIIENSYKYTSFTGKGNENIIRIRKKHIKKLYKLQAENTGLVFLKIKGMPVPPDLTVKDGSTFISETGGLFDITKNITTTIFTNHKSFLTLVLTKDSKYDLITYKLTKGAIRKLQRLDINIYPNSAPKIIRDTIDYNNVTFEIDLCKPLLFAYPYRIMNRNYRKRKSLFMSHRETVIFKANNYNPLKYDIIINNELVSFNDSSGAFMEKEKKDKQVKAIVKGALDITKVDLIIKEIEEYKIGLTNYDCLDKNEIKYRYNIFVEKTETILTITYVPGNLSKKITGLSASETTTLDKLDKLLQELKSASQSSFVASLPISVYGKNIDLVRFNVEKKYKNSNIPSQKATYDIYVRGGIKIDFSVGVFMTGLVDKVYTTKKETVIDSTVNGTTVTVDTTDKHKIVREEDSKFAFAFGTLMNCYYRLGNTVNFAVSVGGALTANQDFQFLTGGTILFGKEERLGFTAGATFGKAKRLTSALKEGDYYEETGTPPTVDKFQMAGYFGVLYNISKKNKTQLAVKE